MIYKPSNPFSIVLFLILLLVQGCILAADWLSIRFSDVFMKSKAKKARFAIKSLHPF